MKAAMAKLLSARNYNGKYDDLALTMLRVFIGATMAFSHGLGKLPPSEMLVGGVASLGFPMPEFFAWCAGLAEFAGGILLMLGLLTRPAAAFVVFTMAVAVFGVHAADPFGQKEMALLYLFASLFFVIHGAGRWSIDHKLTKK
ncbi:DoxX family protein [Bdellovibrio bacteriovorus]|uniref:DoxX family protein n=1 Tax=Bdellovibrio bacteriovorus TaxID=959 RepID=UPI0021CE4349|nr:DoxX family protein [Bdellovibrio bacteriovorus]UXR64733.1 DoxX family protein [Bdellovibrio bacteriovorus]